MLDTIIDIMLQNTYTTNAMVSRLGLLRMYYAEHLFGENKNALIHDILQYECGDDTIAVISTWVKNIKAAGLDEQEVYEELDRVEKQVMAMPEVTLYVPIKFSNQYVEQFGKWFREQVQTNLLIDLRLDPLVAGGCAVVWNGTYYDFSLRYHVQKNRREIIRMFNKHSHVA